LAAYSRRSVGDEPPLVRQPLRPKSAASGRLFYAMSSKFQPDTALIQRHIAAMRIVEELDPEDRVSLLAYVVAPSEAVLEAQELEKAVA
jgi:hypothetical protein